jgi:hypothetical protein
LAGSAGAESAGIGSTANSPPGSALYQHTAHRHQPRNVNQVHRTEQQAAGFNTRVAVWLTKNMGTVHCEISAI